MGCHYTRFFRAPGPVQDEQVNAVGRAVGQLMCRWRAELHPQGRFTLPFQQNVRTVIPGLHIGPDGCYIGQDILYETDALTFAATLPKGKPEPSLASPKPLKLVGVHGPVG